MNKDEFIMPELEVEFALRDSTNHIDGLYVDDPDLSIYDKKWGGDHEQKD